MNSKQKLYRQRVAEGMCTICGGVKQNKYVLKCKSCTDKIKKYRNKEKENKSKKELRENRKKAGICVTCGKRKSADGYCNCDICRQYYKKASKKTRQNHEKNGLCTRCGKENKYQSYKICKECRRKELLVKSKKFIEQGLCRTCGKNPIRDVDSTLCERCHTRLLVNKKKRKEKIWQQILDHYGAKCACCGETIVEFLTIDHINNDGADHKRVVGRDSYKIRSWIVANNFPDTIQILCYNCNCAKGKLGYCPHTRKEH